ncbi:exonuclease domain-containing protein [Bosea sp. RAC05]|uniref:exonuclease domain-containing protein n=1 Tax=Bosea sp. RAC05 TaxID=1842539 RepID=UPI0008575AC0|nr:exonuclease domain-containing protein [Bosea sp. RAC05]AOG03291.1 hypothetical protein BSY19_4846 [Bosea sp. RAC05]
MADRDLFETAPTGGLAALKRADASMPANDARPAPVSDLVCYDAETSDADVRHGQILQFGAVSADANFRPCAETQIRIRRLPYIVPAPEALSVTGFDPYDLDDPSLPTEFTAAQQIRKALAVPHGGTRIFLTFNGIRFDDEMIRTMLARNLLDPWVTSGRGNRRVDVLSLLQVVNAGEPGAIAVPLDLSTGKLSFRLGAVATANAIDIVAHDAMGDSRATLDLAHLIHTRCRWAWDVVLACGNADLVERQLRAASTGSIVWAFSHFGEADLAPCLPICADGGRRWILADLRHAPSAIPSSLDDLGPLSFGRSTPLKVMRAAAAPVIIPGHEIARFGASVTDDLMANAQAWRDATATRERITAAHQSHSYTDRTDPTSEERLYDGFYGNQDKQAVSRFIAAASWDERSRIAFQDPRLSDYAARLVLTNLPPGTELDARLDQLSARCASALARPFAGKDSRWMTIDAAIDTADARWIQWASEAFPALGLSPPAGVRP